MRVTFVRRSPRTTVYVTRDDGSEVSWSWPAHDGPPHDLAHLVVETELGIADGFWGLVADGVDPTAVQSAADRRRTGSLNPGFVGRDLSGLMRAEAAVALAGYAVSFPDIPLADWNPPPDVAAEEVDRGARALRTAAARWAALPDGGTLAYEF